MTTDTYAAPDGVRLLNAVDETLGVALRLGLRDSPAVIFGERSVTYGALGGMVNRYGNAMRALDVKAGDRVLFLMSDSPELVAAYLGAMRVGAVSVAFNVRATPQDLRYVIEDSAAAVLFIDHQFLDIYRPIADTLSHRPVVAVWGGPGDAGMIRMEPLIDSQIDRIEPAPTRASDPAFWLYSSGTTGTPKGVIHRHGDVVIADLHMRENLGVRPGDRIFSTSKLFFAYALGHSLLGGLRSGAQIIVYDGWPAAADIAAIVERHRPSHLFSVPTFYRNLLEDGAAETEAFRAVRCFVSAGEKLPLPIAERWHAATGKDIFEGIGTSETVFLFIANTPAAYRRGSSGRPMPWVEIKLLDEAGEPIETPNLPGQLWVRMASVFAGYWNLPDKTADAFDDQGWYRTGDMFSFDPDGWWHHQGRDDDMLKISGQWVSPAEIERVALSLADVSDAAAVGVPNKDGLVRTALFLVPREGANRDTLPQRVQDTLLAGLSSYKCPRRIELVDEIPRTATGKIQRFKLRQLAAG